MSKDMKRGRRDRVAEQTEIRRKMLANGYVPLANKDKMCTLKGWSKLTVDEAQIDEWSKTRFVATGVRLDGQLGMLDADIDDSDAFYGGIAYAVDHAVDDAQRQRIRRLRDAAPIRYGKGEKEAWFFNVAEGDEGFVRYASAAYAKPGEDPEAEGTVLHRLEVFNGSGRQAGAYGAHTLENGEVVREYSWYDNVGLADVPRRELPEITRDDVAHLCGSMSRYLEERGWVLHFKSKHGQTTEAKMFDLRDGDGRVFETEAGDVDLDGLARLVEASNSGKVRLSASWLEGPAARNRSRCIADIHPIDGRLSILDTATWQSHRPADMASTAKIGALRDALKASGALERLEAAGIEAVASGAVPFFAPVLGDDADGGTGEGKPQPEIMVYAGETTETAKKAARLMARSPRFFDFGGEPAVVTGNKIEVMQEHRLAHELGAEFRFLKPGKKAGEDEEPSEPIKIDPPMAVVKQVLALGAARGLKPLRAVIDVPTIRLDGEVVSANGYDAGVELVVGMAPGVGMLAGAMPALPTRADMASALEVLWAPFRDFPFVDARARGGMLAALLTAAIRPVLPTAPAFAFDAPAQGSGKTLLARCVGALAGRYRLMAPLPVRDEAEVAKVALTMLIEAPRAVIFDNQLGMVDSASLASILTAPTYSGRILGSSRSVEAPTNMVVMMTGNNISLGGDMPRRVVSIRIDAGVETPFTRQFDFDPLAMVEKGRARMVCAALTLIRGAFGAVGEGRVGSFEHWDRLVAQTVAFVGGENGVGRGEFADPTALLVAAHEADPTRETLTDLLSVLRDQFGSRWFAAKDVMHVISGQGPGHRELLEVLEGLGMARVTSKGIGMAMQNRRGQRTGGMVLEMKADAKNGNRYRVVDDADEKGVVISGRFANARAGLASATEHLQK